MSVRVMSWVWEHSQSRKTERLVLLAIADCASDDGGNAYPSMAELTRKTGLSERGVQGCIGKLTATGELIVHRNGGPGGCNRYRVVMTPAGTAPPAGAAGVHKLRGVHKVRGQEMHPPAGTAPQPPQELRDPPARRAPGTVLEPSLEPSVSQKLRSPNGSRNDAAFDEFWSTYPRREAKGAARKAWDKAIKRADATAIIAGAARYRDQPGRDPRYTAHPATWLNADRWSDEAAPAAGRANGYESFRNPEDVEAAYGGIL